MPEVSTTADMMSPLALFLSADVVVKIVMLGLLAASVWTWAIIFTHSLRLRRINRQTEAYERDFWAASDIDGFHAKRGEEKLPTAAVLTAGLDECRRGRKRARPSRRAAQHPRHGRFGRPVRRPVRYGVGDHAQLHRYRRRQQHFASGRRSRYRRGAVRDRHRHAPAAVATRSAGQAGAHQ